jgi:hypothetical protein
VQTHKQTVTIPEDHQLEIRLPEDFPSGPAEVIVRAGSPEKRTIDETQRKMLQVVQELRASKLTDEEDRILDEFEEFRQQHPIDFSSLSEEE